MSITYIFRLCIGGTVLSFVHDIIFSLIGDAKGQELCLKFMIEENETIQKEELQEKFCASPISLKNLQNLEDKNVFHCTSGIISGQDVKSPNTEEIVDTSKKRTYYDQIEKECNYDSKYLLDLLMEEKDLMPIIKINRLHYELIMDKFKILFIETNMEKDNRINPRDLNLTGLMLFFFVSVVKWAVSLFLNIKDSFGLFKLLDVITTSPDKTEDELVEVLSASVEEYIFMGYISKSQLNSDLAQNCLFLCNVPVAKKLFVTNLKKKKFSLFESGQYTEATNPSKYMDVSSEKRLSLMGKSDAVNKRIEKNLCFIGTNIDLKYTVIKVRIYRAVMGNETNRMMISIDTLESVAVDLMGTERKSIFFDLLDHRLLRFESSATISDFLPNMIDPTIRQEVINFSVHELGMVNRVTTLLLSCPDCERLRQRSKQEFISLIQTVVESTFNETTTTRPIFSMVDSEVFERALEGIPQDFVNNLQPEERVVVPGDDNVRQEGNRASETIDSRPIQCIYFPSDCRLFIYIPTENGSYWHQRDMLRASRLNPTYPAITNRC